jgi:cytochrome c biogenesis factor
MALTIFVLTILPVTLNVFSNNIYSVSTNVYNSIAVLFTAIICSLMIWYHIKDKKTVFILIIIAAVSMILFYFFGFSISLIPVLALLLTSASALFFKYRFKMRYVLIHSGIIIFSIGLITAYGFSITSKFNIEEGESVNFNNSTVYFQSHDDYNFSLYLNSSEKTSVANSDKTIIFRSILQDVHFTVIKFLGSMEITGTIRLERGSTIQFEDVELTYTSYDGNSYTVKTKIGDDISNINLSSTINTEKIRFGPAAKNIELKAAGAHAEWILVWIEPDLSKPLLPPMLILDAQTRPLAILIYIGIILLLIGTILSIVPLAND